MSISAEARRKTVRLRRSGGSRSVTVPKDWLDRLGVGEAVDLVESDFGIVIQPAREVTRSIEDEPEFAGFLEFMAKRAFAQPERLANVVEMTAGDDELVRGVAIDD